MKKLTASNDTESGRPKQGLELRSIDVEAGKGKMGKGFTKIGRGAPAGGSRFKKVGVAVGGTKGDKDVDEDKDKDKVAGEDVPEKVVEAAKAEQEDVVMAHEDKDEQEDVTWEEYDFTKPTACHDAPCPGLKTDGIWSGEWVTV